MGEPCAYLLRLSLLGLILALSLLSCAPDEDATIREAQYAAKIVGDWQGIVGDVRETILFSADRKFTSHVGPRGFISDTLGQGATGTETPPAQGPPEHTTCDTGARRFKLGDRAHCGVGLPRSRAPRDAEPLGGRQRILFEQSLIALSCRPRTSWIRSAT